MNPELAYFLKINAGIALFYAFYRLFFYRDTFFQWRRVALLSFFVLSLLYPLMNLQEWIKEQEPMAAMADLYATVVLPEFTPDVSTSVDWKSNILHLLAFLYWSGVVLLSIRFLVQLGSIIRLRISCRKETIQGTHIYQLKQKAGPFSFFQWIFVYPASHTNEELEEILTHELTHVRQRHSIDVLFSELMCIACWFNPFVWLMKREVRSNLEYMADHRVIQTGHDYQSYQFHLLGLANQKAAANLSNSFNVLPLKNRIRMMNKKRTKEIGRTKYLMFLPLAMLLMIVSNVETVARTTESIAKEMIQTITPALTAYQTPPQDKKKQVQKKVEKAESPEESVIFEVVEQMPEYPGGMQALLNFLGKNTRYPAIAHRNGTQGKVIVQFIVEKDGSLSNLAVLESVSPELDAEALRVTSSLPKWSPGKQRGKLVRVRFTLPISFRLSGNEGEEIKNSQLSEIVVVGYGEGAAAGESEPTFEAVEQMPQYRGGIKALFQFLAQSIKYPVKAQENKIQGRVIVSMVINKKGNVTQAQVIKSVSPELDAEAIRIVNNMPDWIPGKQKGQLVNVKYTLPIVFRLIPKSQPAPTNK